MISIPCQYPLLITTQLTYFFLFFLSSLPSLNLNFGPDFKLWCIMNYENSKLVDKFLMEERWEKMVTNKCKVLSAHKCIVVTPDWLDAHNIQYKWVVQRAGELMVTNFGCSHFVLNFGSKNGSTSFSINTFLSSILSYPYPELCQCPQMKGEDERIVIPNYGQIVYEEQQKKNNELKGEIYMREKDRIELLEKIKLQNNHHEQMKNENVKLIEELKREKEEREIEKNGKEREKCEWEKERTELNNSVIDSLKRVADVQRRRDEENDIWKSRLEAIQRVVKRKKGEEKGDEILFEEKSYPKTRFLCVTCGQDFSTKGNLTQHISRRHKN